MTFAAVAAPVPSRVAAGRARPCGPGVDARRSHLRAAGNRAAARAFASPAPARKAACCVGACGPQEPGEELLNAGGQALRRAVLARERRTADPPPSPASSGTPPPPPVSTQTCGPDVTQAVKDIVAKTKTDYSGWSRVKKDEACAALENYYCAGDAWDIVELHNRGWLTGYAPCADQTGPCKDTVIVDGSCSYAGSVNYVIFGVMCELCDIWKSTMEDMIWAYKGHVPFGKPASPNYGPSLAWARAGYDGWPAVKSPAGDRPACSGACPTAYSGRPMRLHWYPASPTETVKASCEEWAKGYDALLTTPPDYGPIGAGM